MRRGGAWRMGLEMSVSSPTRRGVWGEGVLGVKMTSFSVLLALFWVNEWAVYIHMWFPIGSHAPSASPLMAMPVGAATLCVLCWQCAGCENEAKLYCCWSASYCSVECQKEHWEHEHSSQCCRAETIEQTVSSTPTVALDWLCCQLIDARFSIDLAGMLSPWGRLFGQHEYMI